MHPKLKTKKNIKVRETPSFEHEPLIMFIYASLVTHQRLVNENKLCSFMPL